MIPESVEKVCPQFLSQVKFVFIPQSVYERHLQLAGCRLGVGLGC